MKKIISISLSLLSCLSLISCNNSGKNTTENIIQKTPSEKSSDIEKTPSEKTPDIEKTPEQESKQTKKRLVKKSPTSENEPVKTKQPKTGTITKLVNGDLLCYVTLTDNQGKENQVGASFEICAEEKKFLNQKVRLFYKIESVNDCQSAEPCGKTRKEPIVTKMEIIKDKSSTKSDNKKSGSAIVGNNVISGEVTNNSQEKTPQKTQDKTQKNTQTISNGKWTITTSNYNSWTGVNNTGNISYKGCDSNGKCLELTGGKIRCRDGKCVTGWVNKDYVYILEEAITEDGNSSPILIVRQGEKEILKETGFKVIDN